MKMADPDQSQNVVADEPSFAAPPPATSSTGDNSASSSSPGPADGDSSNPMLQQLEQMRQLNVGIPDPNAPKPTDKDDDLSEDATAQRERERQAKEAADAEEQRQKNKENPDYHFPGEGPDGATGVEAVGKLSEAVEEEIPLIGTGISLINAGRHEWDALTYDGMADDMRKQHFDPAQQKAMEESAARKREERNGDLINSIPLFGPARSLM
jgi:hypothetical protein